VIVLRGTVDIWGTLTDDRSRQAIIVAAENIPGVKAVRDHMVWVDPVSGMVCRRAGNVARPGIDLLGSPSSCPASPPDEHRWTCLHAPGDPRDQSCGMTMVWQFVVGFGFILVVNAPQNRVDGTETFEAAALRAPA